MIRADVTPSWWKADVTARHRDAAVAWLTKELLRQGRMQNFVYSATGPVFLQGYVLPDAEIHRVKVALEKKIWSN